MTADSSTRARAFSVLAPDILTDLSSRRMLKVMMGKAGFTTTGLEITDTLASCPTRHILSVGKAGLDAWHEYNLIGIGAHHGSVFRHWDPAIGHRIIMVLHHPATLSQLSITGYEAKDQMAFDLARWRGVVSGQVNSEGLRQATCGRCAMRRGKAGPTRRPAEHWVLELDWCGLCEDCYRARGKIIKKSRGKKPKPGTREAQIAGQTEAFPDGQHLMVSKAKT